MTPEEFYEKFELFAEAPDAVGKMRELVLGFAISGRLVPQNPNEEKAAEQLSRISEIRKARATKAKKSNASTDSDLAKQSEAPLPAGWAEAPLEALLTVINGRAYKKAELLDSGTPVLRVGNLFTSSHWYYSDIELESDKYCEEGDLIYAWSASFGPFIWSGPKAIYHYHIWKLELHSEEEISKRFLYWFLEAKTQEIKSAGRGLAMLHMTKGRMEKLNVPLPPLAEQKRIVAKVDELMALCDELENRQAEREQQKAALHRAALHRFHQSPTPGNLNLLFREGAEVDPAAIRTTVLQLAVRGKLTSHDPNDKPAKQLLEEISESVVSKFKSKKTEMETSHEVKSPPFTLPKSWSWATFQQVANIASNLVKPDKYLDSIHLAPDNIEKGNGVLLPCVTIQEAKVKSSKHRFFPGQIVYSKIRPNLSKVVIVDFEGLCSADMYPIDAHIDSAFLLKYMLSDVFLAQAVKTDTRVAMPKINQTELKAIAVPVPPLAEQKRIVAKVDQLMALVDELEAQQTRSDALARDLLDALVAELTATNAPNPVPSMT